MDLKIKPFCDVLFTSQFAPMLQSDSQVNHEMVCNGNCIESDVNKLKDHQSVQQEIVENGTVATSKSVKDLDLNLPENNLIDKCILISESECQLKKQSLKEANNKSERDCMLLNSEETFSATESLPNTLNMEENCHLSYTTPIDSPASKLDLQLDYTNMLGAANSVDEHEKTIDDFNEETVDRLGDDISKIENGRKRYVCTNCNRVFNSCNALKYHNRTHLGFRPHKCDICEKSFFAISALKTHIRTHTGDKPFECLHCDRKFRQWGDLKYHIVSIHSNEKNHQCEFCGKAFSRKYSLVVHLRIHTSERNYKCEFCSKSFRASTYLQNHRKIHTGD